MLNAVLEEMKRRSKDKSIGQEIEIILNKTINEKKKYIIENAPLSLLTTGWGQEEDKRQKTKDKKDKFISHYSDETIYVWKKINECNNPKDIRYLIYKK